MTSGSGFNALDRPGTVFGRATENLQRPAAATGSRPAACLRSTAAPSLRSIVGGIVCATSLLAASALGIEPPTPSNSAGADPHLLVDHPGFVTVPALNGRIDYAQFDADWRAVADWIVQVEARQNETEEILVRVQDDCLRVLTYYRTESPTPEAVEEYLLKLWGADLVGLEPDRDRLLQLAMELANLNEKKPQPTFAIDTSGLVTNEAPIELAVTDNGRRDISVTAELGDVIQMDSTGRTVATDVCVDSAGVPACLADDSVAFPVRVCVSLSGNLGSQAVLITLQGDEHCDSIEVPLVLRVTGETEAPALLELDRRIQARLDRLREARDAMRLWATTADSAQACFEMTRATLRGVYGPCPPIKSCGDYQHGMLGSIGGAAGVVRSSVKLAGMACDSMGERLCDQAQLAALAIEVNYPEAQPRYGGENDNAWPCVICEESAEMLGETGEPRRGRWVESEPPRTGGG